jgi:hypothetical protein
MFWVFSLLQSNLVAAQRRLFTAISLTTALQQLVSGEIAVKRHFGRGLIISPALYSKANKNSYFEIPH